MKKQTIISLSILSALLAALAAWYFFVFKPRKDAKEDPSKYKEGNPVLWSGCNDNFPIVMGSCGPRVKTLQQYFNKKLIAAGHRQIQLGQLMVDVPIAEDGLFGQKTYAAATKVIGLLNWLKPTGNNMDQTKWIFWSQYF